MIFFFWNAGPSTVIKYLIFPLKIRFIFGLGGRINMFTADMAIDVSDLRPLRGHVSF
jgi:hypothetical protein